MQLPLYADEFTLPIWLHLVAVGVFGLSGAAAAVRRGYDLIGVAALALVTAVGGTMMRDGLFLQAGPSAAITDGRYLLAICAGALMVVPFHRVICHLETPLLTIDALGMATYTIIGAQKAMAANIAIPGVILIGVVNGVGGGILRDVLTRQEPLLFKAGQYYAAASIVGAAIYVSLHELDEPVRVPALAGITAAFLLRLAAVKFNWRTAPLGAHAEGGEAS